MNHGSTSRRLAAGLLALLVVLVPASTAAWAENGSKVAIVAFGLFGDQSVFESEAKGAAAIVANRFGGGPVVVRANTRRRGDATPETLASNLDSVAKEIDHERDLLVVILTSHGSRAGLAVKAGAREETLSPGFLATALRYTGVRHRVVIVSACYSGIFIPLADADTMVITAADANHPSFGCRDGARWTYFGDAFFNTAMRRATNLRDAFNQARGIVRQRELRNGFDPSNPQMAGGENIEPLLVSAASTPLPPIKGRRPGREISAPGVRP
jgi:peptidase C13-like protein